MKRKIVDYDLLIGDGPADLVAQVKGAIREGWEPIGEAQPYQNPNKVQRFAQTMVKVTYPV